MFIKIPDMLSDIDTPAGADERLLSGMPGSSSYLSLYDDSDDPLPDGYEVPDIIPRKRCQFEVIQSVRSVVDPL